MDHAPYSPSDSQRWLTCEAALVLYPKGEDENNEAAQEGTNAHALLERCLKEAEPAFNLVGEEMFDGSFDLPTRVTEDMAEGVQTVLDYVTDRYFSIDDEAPTMWSEVRVHLSDVCYGTLDCALYWEESKVLEIIDLKWGKGHMVEANSPQLQVYAAALLKTRRVSARRVVCTVAQPRGHHADGPIRSHELSGAELALFAENTVALIEDRERLANRGGWEPVATPSEDACRYCPGKDDCGARSELAMSHARHAAEVELPGEGFTEDLKFLIEHGSVIEEKIKLARARLTDQILRGGDGHGFKCIEARSNRKHVDNDEDMEKWFRSKKVKVSDFTIPKLKGIPALETTIKKSYPKLVKEYQSKIIKPQGSPKLVPEDAPGKPYKKRPEGMFTDASDDLNFI